MNAINNVKELKSTIPGNEILIGTYEDLFRKNWRMQPMSEENKDDIVYLTNVINNADQETPAGKKELETAYKKLYLMREVCIISTKARNNCDQDITIAKAEAIRQQEETLSQSIAGRIESYLDRTFMFIFGHEATNDLNNFNAGQLQFINDVDALINNKKFDQIEKKHIIDDNKTKAMISSRILENYKKRVSENGDNPIQTYKIKKQESCEIRSFTRKCGNIKERFVIEKALLAEGKSKSVIEGTCTFKFIDKKTNNKDDLIIRQSKVAFITNKNVNQYGKNDQTDIIKKDAKNKRDLGEMGIKTPRPHIEIDLGSKYYAIEDLCIHGDLKKFMNSDAFRNLTYSKKKKIAYSFLSEVKKLHEKGYLHGDTKLENILIYEDPDTGEFYAMITDFEEFINKNESNDVKLEKLSVSPTYLPPNCINDGNVNQDMDNWAAGLILFQIIYNIDLLNLIASKPTGTKECAEFLNVYNFGYRPAPNAINKRLGEDLTRQVIFFHAQLELFILAMQPSATCPDVWADIKRQISNDTEMWALIKSMLEPDPEKRATAAQLVNSLVFKEFAKTEKNAGQECEQI